MASRKPLVQLWGDRGRRQLFVAGVSPHPGGRTLSREHGNFYGSIGDDGVERRVRAHVGFVRWSAKTECLILVDGVPVGGDIGEGLTAV